MDSLPNPKELIKLAKACRKAGIKAFKGFGFEFTLTDESPRPTALRTKNKGLPEAPIASNSESKDELKPESLTEEELLFWSVKSEQSESEKVAEN